jgi:hypothetical protein
LVFWPEGTDFRHVVTWFQMTRHHRGRLTVEQLKRFAKLLEGEARVLYRTADRNEQHPETAVAGKSVETIKKLIHTRGFGDDTVTESVFGMLDRPDVAVPKTSGEHRALALALMKCAEYLRGIPGWYRLHANMLKDPLEHRGRPPNILLEVLFQTADRLGVTDADAARALAEAGTIPDGPGFDDTSLAERWATIIKSARARRRRKQKRRR